VRLCFRWRVVIHGGIDGYSRLIVFLRASDNNRSLTVMDSFIGAVAKYGLPSRVRTDHGGENTAVWVIMNTMRGSDRGSALRGRSTHNQRIERLWRDLWRGMTNVYHNLFSFLESEGILDIDNEMHLWALRYVYLPRINRDLKTFVDQWNNHGLRTERHQSPMQLFVRGCLEQQGRNSTAMQDIFGARAASAGMEDVQDAHPAGDAEMPAAGIEEASGQGGAPLVNWPGRVEVPPNQFTLDDEVMEQVVAMFDPLSGPIGTLGIELVRGVIAHLESVMH